ncbi:MAG: sulfatase-like hydrolase/transferase [Nanoarchaeota archaeon]|nr:sulfatase-like hydrolase/transferase [Nanoarchaeota archaeon]
MGFTNNPLLTQPSPEELSSVKHFNNDSQLNDLPLSLSGVNMEDLETQRYFYLAEVQKQDAQLASLLNYLRNRENTNLIIVADHGEYFGEKGFVTHSLGAYNEVAHVPLLIHKKGISAEIINQPVSTRRIYHTTE